jgi:hypothetical protein
MRIIMSIMPISSVVNNLQLAVAPITNYNTNAIDVIIL